MLLVSKICAAILLAVFRLAAGLIPLKVYRKLDKWGRKGDDNGGKAASNYIQRRKRIDTILSVFLCFGAGLLLSTCFIHMIPEVRESFLKAAKRGNWTALEEFPFAEAVVCLGFFLVYLLEELAGMLMGHGGKDAGHSHDHKQKKVAKPQDPQSEEDEHKLSTRTSPTDSNGHATLTIIGSDFEESRSRSSSESIVTQLDSSSVMYGPEETGQHPHGHSHGPVLPNLENKSVTAAIRGFLLVFALSFHSVFEGMAIGLQPSLQDVWFLFAAVSVHELAIMFCMGLEMLASSIRTPVYVAYMVTLGLITPIGVAIGIVITEYVTDPSPGHMLTIAVLQAVAAGTLLYVTFLEVLERERAKAGNGLLKYAAVFLGFLLLSLLEAWGHGGGKHSHGNDSEPLNHDHDHDHSSHGHGHDHIVFQPQSTPQYSFYLP